MNDFFDKIESIETKEQTQDTRESREFLVKVDNRLVCKSGLGLLGCKNLIERNLNSLILNDSDVEFDVSMKTDDSDSEFIIEFVIIVKVFGKFCSLRDFMNFIFALNNFNLQKNRFSISFHHENKKYTINGTNLIEDFNSHQSHWPSSMIELTDLLDVVVGKYSKNELNSIFCRYPQFIEKRELQFAMLLSNKIKKHKNKSDNNKPIPPAPDFSVPYRINEVEKLYHPSVLKESIISEDPVNKVYIFADTDTTMKNINYMSTKFINTSQIPYIWHSGARTSPVIKYVLQNLPKLKKQKYTTRYCQFYVTQEHYCYLSFLGGMLYNREMDENIYVSIGMTGTRDFIDSMINKLF